MKSLYGIDIIESPLLIETVLLKLPKKKKNRRWMKKYRKKYSCSKPMSDIFYSEDNSTIYCHPEIAKELKKHIVEKDVCERRSYAHRSIFHGYGIA